MFIFTDPAWRAISNYKYSSLLSACCHTHGDWRRQHAGHRVCKEHTAVIKCTKQSKRNGWQKQTFAIIAIGNLPFIWKAASLRIRVEFYGSKNLHTKTIYSPALLLATLFVPPKQKRDLVGLSEIKISNCQNKTKCKLLLIPFSVENIFFRANIIWLVFPKCTLPFRMHLIK